MSELNHRARAFVDATRFAEDPTEDEERRVRRAIALRIAGATVVATATAASAKAASAAAGTGAAGAGGSALPLTMLVKYVGIGTLVGAAAVGGAVASPRLLASATTPSHSAQAQVVPPVASMKSVVPLPAMSESPESLAETEPAEVTVEVKSLMPEKPLAARASAVPTKSTLDDEIPLIRNAQAAVRAGQWARAETLLNQHATRFPAGIMSEDRAALKVFVLCASGRGAEGRGSAERFLRAHPRSPYAGQVTSSCGLAAEEGRKND